MLRSTVGCFGATQSQTVRTAGDRKTRSRPRRAGVGHDDTLAVYLQVAGKNRLREPVVLCDIALLCHLEDCQCALSVPVQPLTSAQPGAPIRPRSTESPPAVDGPISVHLVSRTMRLSCNLKVADLSP